MSTYAKDDIRSQLTVAPRAGAGAVDASTPVKPAQFLEIHTLPPTSVTPAGSRSWVVRGANCLFVWTDAIAGDRFERTGQVDEYTILMHSQSAPVRVTAGNSSEEVGEEAFIVIPPGDSVIEALGNGPVLRLFSAASDDLTASALNANAYAEPDVRCAPLVPWPDPVGGFLLRVYRLADTPIKEGRFGRIFRTTNLMVNFLAEEPTPRDPLKLSPHSHDDFEQLSLSIKGEFVHHVRYPWNPDSTQWQADQHRLVESPSLTIIPPPTLHTTQGVGRYQQLVDIFSPPRDDFSAAGWVLNAEDYPPR